jgi:hypothetical protein
MKKSKLLLTSLAVSALFFMIAPVFAATYTAYTLPAFKGNNYTGAHGKTTTANYITNKVTGLTPKLWTYKNKHVHIRAIPSLFARYLRIAIPGDVLKGKGFALPTGRPG